MILLILAALLPGVPGPLLTETSAPIQSPARFLSPASETAPSESTGLLTFDTSGSPLMLRSRDGACVLSAREVGEASLQPSLQAVSGDLCPLPLTFGLVTSFLPCSFFFAREVLRAKLLGTILPALEKSRLELQNEKNGRSITQPRYIPEMGVQTREVEKNNGKPRTAASPRASEG